MKPWEKYQQGPWNKYAPQENIPTKSRTAIEYLAPSFTTGYEEKPGERTLLGDVFERPGAAVRSTIRGEGYMKGALRPEEVPTFQEEAKKITPKLPFMNITKNIPLPGTIPTLTVGKMPEAFGQLADIITNPADVLLMVSDILGGKKISKTAGKIGETIFPNKTLRVSNEKPFLAQARKLDDTLSEIQQGMGKQFDNMLEAYKDAPIPIQKVQDAIYDLPKNIYNAIRENPEVRFEATGNIEPTVRNIHNIRRTLSDFMTGKDFLEFTNLKKARIRDSYMKLGNIIKNIDRENIAPVYQQYSNWIDLKNYTDRILKTRGQVVGGKLKSAISGRGEELTQETLEKLAKLFPKANEILKETKRISDRIARNRALGRAVGVVGRAAIYGSPILYGLKKMTGE